MLGLDLGAATIRVAWTDTAGTVIWKGALPTAGRPIEHLGALLEQLGQAHDLPPQPIGVTGGARHLVVARCAGVHSLSEVVASARGAAALRPDAKAVIEIGGKSSRWMALHPDGSGDAEDFALSDLCAAGAGSFLEQQAGRLERTVPELAELAAHSRKGATVAGRCAVFAKSDMIHLQQKGTPTAEIAYGLCLALARNFQARILRGRKLVPPVVLVGGCTANAGLVRALREVLELGEEQLVIPDDAAFAGALGAALLATDATPMALADLRTALFTDDTVDDVLVRLSALPGPGTDEPQDEPQGEDIGTDGVYLGVDVGSVSTDLALVTPSGEVVDAVYLPTRGEPIAVLEEAMGLLAKRHGDDLRVLGVATTGSGRHLAGRFLGADLVHNEITAQLRGAAAAWPEVDTVFEIGGQDAKYIHAQQGHIVDFAMNRICAAGTGSFLEEQATRLGVDIIGEFAALAATSPAPPDLGRRCTVFMETEMVHAMQRGADTADVCAGLALSVVRNYLDRVVAGRAVGENVVFQGGTASNRAVVAAFRQILGRPVRVHPYNRISGALGAALLVIDARADGRLGAGTSFRGLADCHGRIERSFTCHHCTNLCRVNRIRAADEIFFFGDVCERWTSQGRVTGAPPPDQHAVARRNRLLLEHARLSEEQQTTEIDPARAVGLPWASLTWSLLPLWTSLVRAAGKQPVLSGSSTPEVLENGLRHLPSETCLPVKMTCGQVRSLVDRGVQTILLPSVARLGQAEDRGGNDVCAYVQHLPEMVHGTVEATFVRPMVRLDRPGKDVVADAHDTARALGIPERRLQRAVAEGLEALVSFQADLLALGEQVVEQAGDRIAVLIGKPYNVADPFLNLNLARHLDRLGIPALPMECLPLDQVALDQRFSELPWALNRDQVRAALLVCENPRFFPVVVSSFGCGTDGFTAKHLEELLDGRPRLFLEMDEHRAEAGLVTRLEAFADEVEASLHRTPAAPRPRSGLHAIAPRATPRTFMPYFADHAHVFAGALRRRGREVVLLPPPDETVQQLGESLASGRECHPFAMLVGDAARLYLDGELRPGDTFHYPGTILPCLLAQYRDGIRHALNRLGARDIAIETPNFDDSQEVYGLRGLMRLNRGVYLTNQLIRAACATRPYADDPTAVTRVLNDTLRRLGRAVVHGGMHAAIDEGLCDLAAVPTDRRTRRPVVGVAGDLYTRINEFASGELFARLEAMGCEIWPAPFGTEVAEYNAAHRLREGLWERRPRQALTAGLYLGIRRLQDAWAWRTFDGRLEDRPEPRYRDVHAMAEPYAGTGASALVLLNLAKMEHFARGGVSGILNANCFNCMVGSVTAALMDRLKGEHDGLPMANLVYGGSAGTSDEARLEAFVHQVHRYAQRPRSDRGLPRPIFAGHHLGQPIDGR